MEERIKLAMGGDKNNPNVIEVIDIACDECPMSRLQCQRRLPGLYLPIAARMPAAGGAITFDEHLLPTLTNPSV